MTFTLGYQPQPLTVLLREGADFVAALDNSQGNWSTTASIQLRFDKGATWAATIVGARASWSVDKAVVSAMIATGPSAVDLFYVDGTADLLWASGTVSTR